MSSPAKGVENWGLKHRGVEGARWKGNNNHNPLFIHEIALTSKADFHVSRGQSYKFL